MAGSQRVEQLALEIGARQRAQFGVELILQDFLQRIKAIEAEALGEFIIDLGFAGHFDAGHCHVEFGRLAGQIGGAIIGREGHLQGALFIGLGADQLVFKAGDELARTNLDPHAFALAAIERHAIHLAFEIDDHSVTGLGLVFCRGGFGALRRFGEAGDRGIHGTFVGRHDQLFQRQIFSLHVLDGRQDFQADSEAGIALFRQFAIHINLRLGRRAQTVIGDHLVDAIIHSRLQRFTAQSRPVHFLDEVGRHLARTETWHLDGLGHFGQARVQPRGDGIGRDHQRISAAQALVGDFSNLHRRTHQFEFEILVKSPGQAAAGWCGRRDSNPHVFRHWNLNPARLPVPPRPHPGRERPAIAGTFRSARQQCHAGTRRLERRPAGQPAQRGIRRG